MATMGVIEVELRLVDNFTPTLERVIFKLQRYEVAYLNSQPWWRHLRARWALRHARKWEVSGAR